MVPSNWLEMGLIVLTGRGVSFNYKVLGRRLVDLLTKVEACLMGKQA
jgi:hypothetical protein